jgi:hypothetical protein
MKKLYLLIVAVMASIAVALAPNASAQSYNFNGFFGTSPLGSTVNIATATTNSTMYLTNGASSINGGPAFTKTPIYGAFQPVFRLTGAGTSACVLTFDNSVDGANWNTGAFTISVTANGTNWVTGLSSQTLGSIGYVRLASITNPNGTAITNLVVLTSAKTP